MRRGRVYVVSDSQSLEEWPQERVAREPGLFEDEGPFLLTGNESLCFVPVFLEDSLMIRLSKFNTGRLGRARCKIPALARDAVSINQAYTFISETFEPERVAHTANVFDNVYAKVDGKWRPLEVLRVKQNREYEKRNTRQARSG